MKTKSILITASSFIATTLLALDPPSVGSAAPDFSLTDAKGKTHALSQYKGKYVVHEWFNPECPCVKKHYGGGNLEKLRDEDTGKGVAWFTIKSNGPGTEGNITGEEAQKITA